MHLFALVTGVELLKLVYNVNNVENVFPVSKRKHGVFIAVNAG
jgi:hypothetical protein